MEGDKIQVADGEYLIQKILKWAEKQKQQQQAKSDVEVIDV